MSISSGSSVTLSEFKAEDTVEARRLIVEQFFPLRRSRTYAALYQHPGTYIIYATSVAATYAATTSSRVTGAVALLAPLLLYGLLRQFFYVLENFLYKDTSSDVAFAKYWLHDKNVRRLLIARDAQGALVGTGALDQLKKPKEGYVELKRMVVHPTCRRQGIARLLLDRLMSHHATDMQAHTVTLITQPVMRESVEMYKKVGFKESKKRRRGPIHMCMKVSDWPASHHNSANSSSK